MSWQTTEDAIRQRWVAQIVENTTPALETVYSNQERTTPAKQRWARLTVLSSGTNQVSLGATTNRFRLHGIIMVQLFEQIGLGTKDLNVLADLVVSAFRSVIASSVHYRTPSIVHVGRTETWWQLNVHCPFFTDELA